MQRIPATVVSGFLGAGKTTLVREILKQQKAPKVAVVINERRPVDIKAELSENGASLLRPDDRLTEFTTGCACCALREDLLWEIRKIFRAKGFERILLEATEAAEMASLVDSFVLDDGRGTPISRYAYIDALVTVVDATSFLADYASPDYLYQRKLGATEVDARTVSQALIEQIELSDVLVISKTDVAGEERSASLEALLKKLNPRARVVRSAPGKLAVSEILDTNLFNYDTFREAMGSTAFFQRPDTPAEGGFDALGYRRFRPFHPLRFDALARGDWSHVVRSKGFFWLANKFDAAGEWSQAGRAVRRGSAGSFWAATPESEWEVSDERKAKVKAVWEEPFGDRRQELVLVLNGISREEMIAKLDACLLTDEEMALGREGWKTLAGEAPAHDHAHDHDHDHEHHHH